MKIKIPLLLVCLANLIFLSNHVLADFIDDFDSPNLDKKVWALKLVGKASHEIKGGTLKIESPAVDSGAMLYHPRNLQDVDITFEIKVNVSELGDNISMGFIAALLEPQVNTEINNNLESTFYFVPDKWYIKQDPVVIGEKPPNPPQGMFIMVESSLPVNASYNTAVLLLDEPKVRHRCAIVPCSLGFSMSNI